MNSLGKRRKNSNHDEDHKKSKVVVKEKEVIKKVDSDSKRTEYNTRRKSREYSRDDLKVKDKNDKKSDKDKKSSSRNKESKKKSDDEEEDDQSEELEYADFNEISENEEEFDPQREIKEAGDFSKYPIHKNTCEALKSNGIAYLFPIQAKTFNQLYEGFDLIGRDRTGSGKTQAFAVPTIERLRQEGVIGPKNRMSKKPKIVILVPTRELCIQVGKEFAKLSWDKRDLAIESVYGGTDIREQCDRQRNGVDVVVATPGRLLDLSERNAIQYSECRAFVLDETDQMLDIGFQEHIEKILEYITQQNDGSALQKVLFSATIPEWVRGVANKFMDKSVVTVDLVKNSSIQTTVTVDHLALFVPQINHKIDTMRDVHQVYGGQHSRTIIFTETKQEANDIMLKANLKQECQVLHGDIPQKQREITFEGFRQGKFKCLIATNVAARGLDIPEVDLIIQLGPPKDVESYIHRSGRTARAGRKGVCITFYTRRQTELITRIERIAKIKFKKVGAPQPNEIIEASARDIATSFAEVSKSVLNPFARTAEDLVEQFGEKEALQRALAIISGNTQAIKQRSQLWAADGYVTVLVKVRDEIRSLSYVWGIQRRNFSQELVDSIRGMKFQKDRMGTAFDVSEDSKAEIESAIADKKFHSFEIEFPTDLPELEDDGQGGYGGGSGGYNNRGGGGYGGSSGGYGNRNGGYNSGNRDNYGRGNYGDRNNSYNNDRSQSRTVGGRGGDDSKLYLGNLAYNTSESQLKDFIKNERYRATDVYIVKDQNGESRGFGYAVFGNQSDAKEALGLNNRSVNGRALRVNFANEKPGGGGGSGGFGRK